MVLMKGAAPHHSGSHNFNSPPSAGAMVGLSTDSYFSPALPLAAYYGALPSGHIQQQMMFYNSPRSLLSNQECFIALRRNRSKSSSAL